MNLTRGGEFVAFVRPEKRAYREPNWVVTRVAVHRTPLQDIQVFFRGTPDNSIDVVIARSPFKSLVWVGWIVLTIGGLWALFTRRLRRPARQTLPPA